MNVQADARHKGTHTAAHINHRTPSLPRLCAQELEFIIHPDGRVEERVRGIKGASCTEVTAEINEALGEVYDTKPTQEMFEEQVAVSEWENDTVSDSWESDGGSSNEW